MPALLPLNLLVASLLLWPGAPAAHPAAPAASQTLAVRISGPASVKPGATCTWTALVKGGPVDSYIWFDYTSTGTLGDGPTHQATADASGTFDIHLEVSAGLYYAEDQLRVTVSPSAPDC